MKIALKLLLNVFLFLAGCIAYAWFEYSFSQWVRKLILYFYHDKVTFFGKGFHLFPGYTGLVAAGVYVVAAVWLLRQMPVKRLLLALSVSIVVFVVTIAATAYLDTGISLAACTACKTNMPINVSDIWYDGYFALGVLISLLVLFVFYKTIRET